LSQKITPILQSEPNNSSKGPRNTQVTSGPLSTPSLNASFPHHMNTNLTVTSNHEPTTLPTSNGHILLNMAPLQVSDHHANFPPRIFIFIDDPSPLVRIQVPTAFPLEIHFHFHSGPPYIYTELHSTFHSSYRLKFKFYRLSLPLSISASSERTSYIICIKIVPRTYPNPETMPSDLIPIPLLDRPPLSPSLPTFLTVNKPLPPPPYHLCAPPTDEAQGDNEFVIPRPTAENPSRNLWRTLSNILRTILCQPPRDRFDNFRFPPAETTS